VPPYILPLILSNFSQLSQEHTHAPFNPLIPFGYSLDLRKLNFSSIFSHHTNKEEVEKQLLIKFFNPKESFEHPLISIQCSMHDYGLAFGVHFKICQIDLEASF
jgi:hypothetical protein